MLYITNTNKEKVSCVVVNEKMYYDRMMERIPKSSHIIYDKELIDKSVTPYTSLFDFTYNSIVAYFSNEDLKEILNGPIKELFPKLNYNISSIPVTVYNKGFIVHKNNKDDIFVRVHWGSFSVAEYLENKKLFVYYDKHLIKIDNTTALNNALLDAPTESLKKAFESYAKENNINLSIDATDNSVDVSDDSPDISENTNDIQESNSTETNEGLSITQFEPEDLAWLEDEDSPY